MIWLVDDDPDEMYLLQRALRRLRPECVVRLFEDYEEALMALATEAPAVLVSDLNMPGTDGIAFLASVEAILEQKGAVQPRMLLITAAIPHDIKDRTTILRHLHEVITKPDLPQDLASHLVSLLPL